MNECSKIVLLGGTLSDGKSYQTAYFTVKERDVASLLLFAVAAFGTDSLLIE